MAISKALRFLVLRRDNYTCRYCGRSAPEVVLHVDHVVPRIKGGRNKLGNLITACFDCNMGKGALDALDPAQDTLDLFRVSVEAALRRMVPAIEWAEAAAGARQSWLAHGLDEPTRDELLLSMLGDVAQAAG
jgi:hypothetical protein